MAVSQILCLANSTKENARCIAGIDLTTSRFVRPVAVGSQSIPNTWAELDGNPVRPLDVLRIPFVRGDAVVPFQSENRYCTDGWKRISRWRAKDTQLFWESDSMILGTPDAKPIIERRFKLMRGGRAAWRSLQLIHAREVQSNNEDKKWIGCFQTRNGREYKLRVTDDHFTSSANGSTKRDCVLLLSLTRPWRHYLASKSKRKKCYKLIAGVMPL